MNNRFLLLLLMLVIVSSCSKDERDLLLDLSEYEIEVIEYFKEIALGFEFGNASSITRKWNSDLKIFVGGAPNAQLLDELERIKIDLRLSALR